MFNLHNLFTSAAHSRSHLPHFISVRWWRRAKKPSWLGMAKSKMFNLREKKELPQLEREELDRLTHIYNRQMLSLKQFMTTDQSNKVTKASISQIIEENLEKSKLLIDEWNAKSAVLRKERLEREKLEQEDAAIKKIMEAAEKSEYIETKVEEIITAEIAASSSFVTKDNLDRVLDECLNNVQDYNYALDLKGNIYKGESTVPVATLTPTNIHELRSEFKLSISKKHKPRRN